MSLQIKYNEWRAQNPLYMWRAETATSKAAVCMITGVGLTSLNKWESGESTPTDENMELLSMAMHDPKLKEKWSEWILRGKNLATQK